MDKQEFLILGKSAKGRALCELISRATAEPGIHTFGELLCLPNVQDVSWVAPGVRGRGGSASTAHVLLPEIVADLLLLLLPAKRAAVGRAGALQGTSRALLLRHVGRLPG